MEEEEAVEVEGVAEAEEEEEDQLSPQQLNPRLPTRETGNLKCGVGPERVAL